MNDPNQPHPYRDDALIMGVMLGGFALNLFSPLWLKPPHFMTTSCLYVLSLFAWLPLYLWLRRAWTNPRRIPLFAMVGGLLTCFGCMLFAPSMESFFGLGFLDNITCEETHDGDRVHYVCTRHSFEGPDYNQTIELEGYGWLPIVWRE